MSCFASFCDLFTLFFAFIVGGSAVLRLYYAMRTSLCFCRVGEATPRHLLRLRFKVLEAWQQRK